MSSYKVRATVSVDYFLDLDEMGVSDLAEAMAIESMTIQEGPAEFFMMVESKYLSVKVVPA